MYGSRTLWAKAEASWAVIGLRDGVIGGRRPGLEPVDPGMSVAPDDDVDLAHDVADGHGAPVTAVVRVTTAVTHHEVVAGGDLGPGDVLTGFRTLTDELRQPGLGD